MLLRKIRFSLLFLSAALAVSGQTQLTISGKTYTNTDDTWTGVNIPRSTPTSLVFKNNSISSINRYGYLLQAGDEGVNQTNNNLDGALISGNKLKWTGTDMTVIPHGIFTGHNKNVIIRYNYLDNVPMGIIRKSANNMSNTSGGVAYNIVKSGQVGMVVKGMSNVNIFNNTFYNDRTTAQTWRPLIHIYTNTDNGNNSVSHGTKIYNNIFYTKYETLAITIADAESLNGLECDYNVYWCETGSPKFSVNGSIKSFSQWQAMGYDLHSVVKNPQFEDFVNFVPASRLDYGKDLGTLWKDGLSPDAAWGVNDPATATQNGKWQVGAIIYPAPVAPPVVPPVVPPAPVLLSSVIEQYEPSLINIIYDCKLAAVVPPLSAFDARVNGSVIELKKVEVIGSQVVLTLSEVMEKGQDVTVSYTKPATNPLQSASGVYAESFANKPVTNKSLASGTDNQVTDGEVEKIAVYPNPVTNYVIVEVSSPGPDFVRLLKIFDFAGKLCLEKEIENDGVHKLPLNLKPGFFVLYICEGSVIRLIKKIIVVRS